jgi:hypothetical protein
MLASIEGCNARTAVAELNRSDNEMRFARKADSGRIATVIAALGTLSGGLATSAVPWGPWSTVFLLVAPAIPAAVLWRALDVWARLVLAGAAALVVDAVVAEVMLTTGTWSLPGGIVAVAVVSALLWLGNTIAWDITARGRISSPQGPSAEHGRGGAHSW